MAADKTSHPPPRDGDHLFEKTPLLVTLIINAIFYYKVQRAMALRGGELTAQPAKLPDSLLFFMISRSGAVRPAFAFTPLGDNIIKYTSHAGVSGWRKVF